MVGFVDCSKFLSLLNRLLLTAVLVGHLMTAQERRFPGTSKIKKADRLKMLSDG